MPQRERLLRLLVKCRGKLPLREAADLLGTSVQSLSPITKRLEEAGFIVKTWSDIDPRMKDLAITKEGRKFLRDII
jgi:DNA-binding MarR family transcriptional regulator